MAIILPIVSRFDDSGIKAAQRGASGFGKTMKGLKGTIAAVGLGVGIAQLGRFAIQAAKAAQADLKSQKLLETQLKRTAKATKAQVQQSEDFIQALSNQVGILDDNLRPALGNFARVTGSTTKAQKLLKIAVDASAMSGKPLATVQNAISKAYAGTPTALKRLFPELAKVEAKYVSQYGKADTLAKKTDLARLMMEQLEKTSSGIAAQQASPFDKFNVAMDNLKEKFGAKILPVITQVLTKLIEPGGLIDRVGGFLDDMANPETEAGRVFLEIKDSAQELGDKVSEVFGKFDPTGKGNGLVGVLQLIKGLVDGINLAIDALSGKMLGLQTVETATSAVQAGQTALWALGGKKGPAPKRGQAAADVAKFINDVFPNSQAARDAQAKVPYGPPQTFVTINTGVVTNGQDVGKYIAEELKKFNKRQGVK